MRGSGATGEVGSLLARSDYWRRSPASAGGAAGHKEWSHFCVLADPVDLLINWSLTDAASGQLEEPRLTMLARSRGGRWEGDVESFEPGEVALRAGHPDARFGDASLRFDGRDYRLRAGLRSTPLEAHLTLSPITRPAATRSVPLGGNQPMRWLVVPRLEASGTVRVGEELHALHGAPAYHDRNWGEFGWGGDFSWEWAVVLPARSNCPWSLVYNRITDHARHRTVSQGILLWRRERHCRTFRDRELSVRGEGFLRVAGALRVPRVISLASPGSVADIPKRLEIEARCGGDALDVTVELDDCAQVGIPNDHDDGVTLITETRGSARVSGHVRGEAVQLEGPTLVEFNRAA